MTILLFTLFILSTLVLFYRLIFPDKAARIKFEMITKLGVAGYGIASVFNTIIFCILSAVASQFLYFKNYYFYASITAAIFFSIIAVFLIFGHFLSISDDRDSFQLPKFTDEWQNTEIKKIRSSLIFKIIFRLFYFVAWLKTFQFFSLEIDIRFENYVVGILYFMTAYKIVESIIKSRKELKQKRLKSKTG